MKTLENKVIYQIYPKSFLDTTGSGIGDINGIRTKLDYIKELGVDYVWLSPCCKSPQKDNGYDIADYTQIDEIFGTNADYEAFIHDANDRGLKVMMDLVLNHTSDQHEWFQKALKNDPIYRDYYIWRDEPNAITSIFGGTAWTFHEESKQYYFHLFDKAQPDLNWENPNVRMELYAMINKWIEKGIEGFRLDVIDLIGKEPDRMITAKGPKFYEYLKEMNEQTFQDKLLTVGECWGSTLEESLKMCNDKGLTQAFHFHNLCLTNNGDKFEQYPLDLQKLCDCLTIWQNDYSGIEAIVMNNHDQPRLLSVWLDDTTYRKQSAKLLITLFGLMKGNLYIYQGEEIGMTNAHRMQIEEYNDVETLNKYKEMKEIYEDEAVIMEKISLISRDNARVPMQWNASKHAGFSTGTPWMSVCDNYEHTNVEKDMQDEDGIYAYYQEIIKFRKEHYDLIDKSSHYRTDSKLLEMNRKNLHVLANFTSETIAYKKPASLLFKNYKEQNQEEMRPYEVIVWMA